jgi:hypothetical protein
MQIWIDELTKIIESKITALKHYDPKTAEKIQKQYLLAQGNIELLLQINEILHMYIELHEIQTECQAS